MARRVIESFLLFDIVAEGAVVTPDQFDWYFYQGRAIGLQVELNGGSFCNGKILMGSYMKKPLWVDHSATTVSTHFSYDCVLRHIIFSLSVLLRSWKCFYY